jgi:hypothetical protein
MATKISIIKPEATINYVLNPSAEGSGSFAALGAATVTVDSADKYSFYGYRSYKVIATAAAGDGINLTTGTLSNAIHYVTFAISGNPPTAANLQVSLDNGANWNAVTLIKSMSTWALYDIMATPTWRLYYVQIPAAQANASTSLRIRQADAVARTFYIDGVQCEAKDDHWTTYCDGSLDGCEWLGAHHGSSSQRSAQYRGGGRVYDLDSDWNMRVDALAGLGMPPQRHNVRDLAMQPGALLQNIKVQPRIITLSCHTNTTTESTLYTTRRNTIDALKDDLVVTGQPVRLRYTGTSAYVECDAYYDAGLEGFFQTNYHEVLALRLIAYDPFWYETRDGAAVLDNADSVTMTYCTGRLNGQWNSLGPPSSGGVVFDVVDDATYVYFGGSFTNWNGNANSDLVVRYEKATGTWSPMGAGLSGTVLPEVWALCVHPNGNVYIGGSFLNAGTQPYADYFCAWTGAAYEEVGKPASGATIVNVLDIAVDSQGDIYVVGNFTNFAGIADADYVARWDISASTWNAVGAPSTGATITRVYAVDIDANDNVYVGGVFTNFAGVAEADYVAMWDGTSWTALDTGFNFDVNNVLVAPDNSVYAIGNFTATGDAGTSLARIAVWNGAVWSALGDGLNGAGWIMDLAPDNTLYVGGQFTQAGTIDLADHIARWNGYTWAHLDINFPGTPSVYGLLVTDTDPVVQANYDVYLGFSSTGATTQAGVTPVTNEGTATAYPRIFIYRSGGTTATLKSIRNETTGKELLFDLDVLDGETVTIDLRRTKKTITSDWRGNIVGSLLPNSDMASFYLLPGDNMITCFMDTTGSPTINSYMTWRVPHWSVSGAE